MEWMVPLFPPDLLERQAVAEIVQYNERTAPFGLTLTPADAKALVETRGEALRTSGRVEFGGGIIDKLIDVFCDSPFLHQRNYTETLHALLELFYYFKNESLDKLNDAELLAAMKASFDGECRGSVELLQGRELEWLAHCVRFEGSPEEEQDELDSYFWEEIEE